MRDAWSTVVTREPEWDSYARAEAIALLDVDRTACPECHQEDTYVPVPSQTRHWTWLDGRKYEVQQFRCLACAAVDTVKRDFETAQSGKTPATGSYAPSDGLRMVVRPVDG